MGTRADSIASWWNLIHAPKVEGLNRHEGKAKLVVFNDKQRPQLIEFAHRWRDHALYWEQADRKSVV